MVERAPRRGLARASRPPGSPAACDPRVGVALPLAVLMVLAVTALAHGVLVLALEEDAGSRASSAVLQARLLAEGALRRAAEGQEDTLPLRSGAVLLEGAVPRGAFRVELRRLGREMVWLEGVGKASLVAGGPQRVEERTARLLWTLSPLERVGAFAAVVEHGGGASWTEGAVDGWGAGDAGAWPAPRGCLDRGAALDSVAGPFLPSAASVSFPAGSPFPGLGLLPGDSLQSRIPARVAGAVTPAPVTEGDICSTEAPSNWGSPGDPAGPCGGHRPSLVAEGDLRIAGGEGQGLLAVAGDLTLDGGARFDGLVLVGGDLVMEEEASLRGLVRVRGSVILTGGARISGRLCPALLALEAAPALRRPLPLPGGGWIRPL